MTRRLSSRCNQIIPARHYNSGNSSSSAVLKAWGVHIGNKLAELTGRVIPGPVLRFNSKKVLDFRDVTKSMENQLNFMKQKTDCYFPVSIPNQESLFTKYMDTFKH